ncbi:MAG: dipeptidase [Bacteroidales bacterium]|nr:dipeptidase [Bacteroidales bacterium]MBP3270554.1 dipeptidase [Bacteroidales bacterium]
MVKKLSLSFVLVVFVSFAEALAQGISYPESVKVAFEKADAEITEYYGDGKILRFAQNDRKVVQNDKWGERKGKFMARPRIAVPDCEEAELIKEMVRKAGGDPVDMPRAGCGAVELRIEAMDWDGAFLPDGWVKKQDEYSVLVYKTIAEWNIPCLGESPLTKIIDNGLLRLPQDIKSIEVLIEKARIYRKAAGIMEEVLTIDTHCDLPDMYSKGWSVGTRNQSQASVPRMDEGRMDAQVLISFLWQGPTDDASSRKAVEKNLATISKIKEDIAKHKEICAQATSPAEVDSIAKLGKKAFIIALENGYGIGNDLGNIKKMKDLGVAYISLSHFRDNAICNTSSRHGSNPSKGLTEYGREVVEEMNRQGIMVDLSHPSAGTFWDCIRLSKAPIICSHSGAKAVYGHDRGLDDSQLKALAEKGGVIQVYTVPEYLGRPRGSMTIDDVMAHFNHCVKVAGAGHVGIGSDFDGGGGVWGCNGDNDLINLTIKMLEYGYTHEQIKGFWGGNFLRVWGEVLSVSESL